MGARMEALMAAWEYENDATLRVMRAAPEGKGDLRPDDRGWRMADLAWHLPTSERWFCTGAAGLRVAGRDPVPKDRPPAGFAAMADAKERSHRALAAAVRRRGERWLAKVVDFYGMSMSRERLLGLMIRHEVHHRGQLSVYLRLAGGKVPSIYGPSADVPFDASGSPLK